MRIPEFLVDPANTCEGSMIVYTLSKSNNGFWALRKTYTGDWKSITATDVDPGVIWSHQHVLEFLNDYANIIDIFIPERD